MYSLIDHLTNIYMLSSFIHFFLPFRTQPTAVMTSGFLVLLKEIMIASPNQTISLQELENRVTAWQRSPASLLCGWLSLEPNWSKVVSHALRFMSGNIPSIVPVDPRVQYDLTTQMWTWIGLYFRFCFCLFSKRPYVKKKVIMFKG